MVALRLASGVTVSTNNTSIAQQYLKYGAVELKEKEAPVKEDKVVEDETSDVKKTRKVKK